MKKLITLILTGILATNIFALGFKAKEGIALCDATISVTDTKDHIRGAEWTVCNFTELSLYNDYLDINARTTNSPYFNTVDATASVFYDFQGIVPYISGSYHFGGTKASVYFSQYNYADVVAGTKAYVDKEWIKITGEVNFGWCFLDETKVNTWEGHFTDNRNNVTTATLGINVEFRRIVELFASMQSYQIAALPTFIPTSVNNRIGIKAHYWFNDNWEIYGEFSHFCKHPERPGKYSNYETYADNSGSTAVIGIQFRY